MWRYNWIWRSVAHSSSWYFYIRVVYLLKRKYPIAPMKINTAIYIDQAFCHVLACQLRCSSFTLPFKSCILYNRTRFPSVLWVVKLRETRPKPHWNGREQFQSFQCARGGVLKAHIAQTISALSLWTLEHVQQQGILFNLVETPVTWVPWESRSLSAYLWKRAGECCKVR